MHFGPFRVSAETVPNLLTYVWELGLPAGACLPRWFQSNSWALRGRPLCDRNPTITVGPDGRTLGGSVPSVSCRKCRQNRVHEIPSFSGTPGNPPRASLITV